MKSSADRTYIAWINMMARCYKSTDTSYRYYGKKGIKVCPHWHTFSNFLNDMGAAPEGLELDRVDSNKDYCKDNCRWATHTTQMRNRGLFARNTSGLSGVWWDKSRNRWQVRFNQRTLGYFHTLLDAAASRKSAENLWSYK